MKSLIATLTRVNSFAVAALAVALGMLSVGALESQAIIISVEAESASLTGLSEFETGADILASGGEYLDTKAANSTTATPSSVDHIGTLSVSGFTAGSYDLYFRIVAVGTNPNSVHFAPDFGDYYGANGGSGWRTINDGGNIAPGDPFTDIDGGSISSPSYGWVKDTITYTAASFTETYQLARREGIRLDALAFVTTGQTVTSAELDASLIPPPAPEVPEPSSLLLLGLGGFGLARHTRRRRNRQA